MLNLTAGVVKELRYRRRDLNSPKIEEPLKNKLRQQVVLGSSTEMAQSEIYRATVCEVLGSTIVWLIYFGKQKRFPELREPYEDTGEET